METRLNGLRRTAVRLYGNKPSLPNYWVIEIKDLTVGVSELSAGNWMLEGSLNPSNEWTVFNDTMPLTEIHATLTLTDAQGRQIETITLQRKEGQKLIDVRILNPRICILTCNGLICSGKLVFE